VQVQTYTAGRVTQENTRKIQRSLFTKPLSQLDGDFLNCTIRAMRNLQQTSFLTGSYLNFFLQSGTRLSFPLTTFSQCHSRWPNQCNKARKRKKRSVLPIANSILQEKNECFTFRNFRNGLVLILASLPYTWSIYKILSICLSTYLYLSVFLLLYTYRS
jgi:hypothetical protein